MTARMTAGVTRQPVDRSALASDPVEVAPWLLGKLLLSRVGGDLTSGRIAEVEAYREDDPASHSHRGVTPRTRPMFGPPGHAYVYLSYGIHRCVNVVAAPEGTGAAVLVRALHPIDGEPEMVRRRGRTDRLVDGPGKLCQALGIELSHDGIDLCDQDSALVLVDDGFPPPGDPLVGPRIGISKAVERPWRFRLPE